MPHNLLIVPTPMAHHAGSPDTLPDYRLLRRVPDLEEIRLRPSHQNGLVKLAILDCETTGLDTARDTIIELAITQVVINSDGEIVQLHPCRNWLNEPPQPIEPIIVQITGLTDEVLAGQHFDDDAICECLDWADVLVSQNAAFDRGFLAERFPDAIRNRRWGCTLNDIDWRKHGFGGRSQFQLLTETGWFYAAHRAGPDCWALMWLLAQRAQDAMPFAWHLIEQVRTPSWRILAVGAPIAVKDRLKSRGYRWDPARRLWWRDIRREEEAAEREWLTRTSPLIRPVCKERTCYDRYG